MFSAREKLDYAMGVPKLVQSLDHQSGPCLWFESLSRVPMMDTEASMLEFIMFVSRDDAHRTLGSGHPSGCDCRGTASTSVQQFEFFIVLGYREGAAHKVLAACSGL
eukprot:gnl/TRDRNA2_/TRDRNA2_175343_c0_seq6.p1 gnl/TRDRNA2_/TRDRNA2_175343_c0~~gnl/TRDRNA2_/TRDRNA2_175343_c0_seq6.p1  ORF type:complete len:107 (+),score=7.29 gnl/TRDRNA2_/TRDRNA2_175343_c0_seq6:125-445(+)